MTTTPTHAEIRPGIRQRRTTRLNRFHFRAWTMGTLRTPILKLASRSGRKRARPRGRPGVDQGNRERARARVPLSDVGGGSRSGGGGTSGRAGSHSPGRIRSGLQTVRILIWKIIPTPGGSMNLPRSLIGALLALGAILAVSSQARATCSPACTHGKVCRNNRCACPAGRNWHEATQSCETGPATGHSTTGHSTTGHSTTGHSTTGHSTTGHSTTGHSTTGHSTTGHSTTGHSTTGHSTTGHSTTGHSTTGHSTTGHSTTGHSTTGHSTTGHSTTTHGTAADHHGGDASSGGGATASGALPDCYLQVVSAFEGGHATAGHLTSGRDHDGIGHDENAFGARNPIPAAIHFLSSGSTHGGRTFRAPPNPPAQDAPTADRLAYQRQGTHTAGAHNDDRYNANAPPDYGLDGATTPNTLLLNGGTRTGLA